MIEKVLESLGLNAKEVKLYLAGLELGQAPASTIARKAGENRVTAYGLLKDMAQKGIVTISVKGATQFFMMLSPEELVKEYQQRLDRLEQHVPELVGLMSGFGNKPTLKMYEGVEGLKQVYNGCLKTNETFLCFLGTQDIHPDFHDFLENDFLPRREHCPTKARTIVSKQPGYYQDYNRDRHDSVVIDDPLFDIANEIVVYDHDKVLIALFSKKEMSAIVITSKAFHDCMAGIFELIFKQNKMK